MRKTLELESPRSIKWRDDNVVEFVNIEDDIRFEIGTLTPCYIGRTPVLDAEPIQEVSKALIGTSFLQFRNSDKAMRWLLKIYQYTMQCRLGTPIPPKNDS